MYYIHNPILYNVHQKPNLVGILICILAFVNKIAIILYEKAFSKLNSQCGNEINARIYEKYKVNL